MNISQTTRWILTFVILCFYNITAAQNISKSLDAKNGFRDAKFGMLLSSFKNLYQTESQKHFSNNNDGYVYYSRSSDALNIGDIKLNSIEYTFYKNRLNKITIHSDLKNDISLFDTFVQVYGKGKPIKDGFEYSMKMSMSDNKALGYTWQGASVQMDMWFGTVTLSKTGGIKSYSDAQITMYSTKMNSETDRANTKQRAADL